MFKLAAVAATVAASPMDEINDSIDMWKYTVHEKELKGLEKHAKALEHESQVYEHQLQGSKVGKVFEHDMVALVHTEEFVALAKYVEMMKKMKPTPQMQKFAKLYQAQMQKVQMAHMKMKMHAEKGAKVWGSEGDHHMTVDIDNDEWYDFNAQYYKLREMEYYAMYKIPEIAKFRAMVTAVTKTGEMKTMQGHWKSVTMGEQHQTVVKHQAKLLIEMLKVVHMTKADEKWVDPKYSPVMFEVWHAVYLYFVAVGHGDIQPMLDFMIDGKYDEKFAKEVQPDFGKPKEELNEFEDMYLF